MKVVSDFEAREKLAQNIFEKYFLCLGASLGSDLSNYKIEMVTRCLERLLLSHTSTLGDIFILMPIHKIVLKRRKWCIF